jgi:hypothetical protein
VPLLYCLATPCNYMTWSTNYPSQTSGYSNVITCFQDVRSVLMLMCDHRLSLSTFVGLHVESILLVGSARCICTNVDRTAQRLSTGAYLSLVSLPQRRIHPSQMLYLQDRLHPVEAKPSTYTLRCPPKSEWRHPFRHISSHTVHPFPPFSRLAIRFLLLNIFPRFLTSCFSFVPINASLTSCLEVSNVRTALSFPPCGASFRLQ